MESTVEEHHELGQAALLEKLYHDALVHFQMALRLNPDYVPSIRGRATANRLLHDWSAALAHYDKALNLEPDNAELLAKRAEVHYKHDDHASVIADAVKSVEIQPSAAAYHSLTRSYAALGQKTIAREHLNYAIALENREAEVFSNQAMSMLEQLDMLSKASEAMSEQVELFDPENEDSDITALSAATERYSQVVNAIETRQQPFVGTSKTEVYSQRLVSYYTLEDWPKVKSTAETLLSHDPENSLAFRLLGYAVESLNDPTGFELQSS